MGVLLVVHAVLAIAAPALVRAWHRRAFWILALPPAATFVWALSNTRAALSGDPPLEHVTWVPSIGLELAFRLDPLSWLLCLVVGGVGALVLAYCSAYFVADEPGLGRFAGCLLGFAGAMLGLVTSDDLLVLYLFWEATTVLSYLLIGHRPESGSSRTAATQALVVTTFGGLAMLVGLIIVGERAGTYRLSEVIAALTAHPPTSADPAALAAVALILLGALTKSALVPFHFWLPGAMAAPTPVSAYLHAAAMVKAGIYLVARFAPAYAEVPLWRVLVLVLGGTTMVLGAYRSLRQHDLKQLLAYGTVSQLGFLTILVGSGTSDAALAGVAMLLAHALYKSCLFLVVGTIDHTVGTRDLRELSGIARQAPWLAVAGCLGAASMAGLPPLLGFVGKEAAYAAYADAEQGWAPWVLAVLVLGSVLTFAYTARFVWGAFADVPGREPQPMHAPGPVLQGVPLLLGTLGLVAGPLAPALEPALRAYADGVGPQPATGHLTLWHGFTLALGLTLLTWLAGGLLAAQRTRVELAQERAATIWGTASADATYRHVMLGLDRGSLFVTAAMQRGSLPLSLALILTVFIALPGGSVLLGTDWSSLTWRFSDGLGQVLTALVMVFAAIMAVRARRRMRAVFLVGVTGYGCAVLFLIFGAPDIALTQILVETVSILLFVLVLRRLPDRFPDERPRGDRVLRACFGIAVGVVAAALALVLPNARTAAPASTGLGPAAVEYGGGHNIVNIILVDVRAWDTMGELSVVLAAATGIASLIFLEENRFQVVRDRIADARSRRRAATRLGQARGRWLSEDAHFDERQRSVMFEVVTRLVFHTVLLWSVFLLVSGHNDPGGGFAAGLMGGLALALRYLAGGREELRAAIPVLPGWLLGIGLFLSAGNGLASMIAGGDVLQTWIFDIPVPLIGTLHIVTSLVFDIGVYLVVVGLMLDILRSLGAGIDAQVEREYEETPARGATSEGLTQSGAAT